MAVWRGIAAGLMAAALSGPAFCADPILDAVTAGEKAAVTGGADALRKAAAGRDDAVALASLAAAADDPGESLKLLSQALERSPDFPSLRGLVAMGQLALGRAEEAVETLEPLPAASPNPFVIVARARQRLLAGSADSACDLLEWGVKVSRSPIVAVELALLQGHSEKRDWEKRRAAFDWLYGKTLLPRDSRDLGIHINRTSSPGYSWRMADAGSRSSELLRAALGACPRDPETLYSVGRICGPMRVSYRQGQHTALTLTYFRNAAAMQPSRHDIAVWRALYELGSYAGEPLAGYAAADRLPKQPTSAVGPVMLELASLTRGLHLYFLGDYTGASAALTEGSGHEAWGHGLMLADALASAGHAEAALETAEAWSVNPHARCDKCQAMAERLREFLDTWSLSCRPNLAEELADRWYVRAYEEAEGGPHQTAARWLSSWRKAGKKDWIDKLFGGFVGDLIDPRELEKYEKGCTEGLPRVHVWRTRPRPSRMDSFMDRAVFHVQESFADRTAAPEQKGTASSSILWLSIGVVLLLGALKLPSGAPWLARAIPIAIGLVMLARGAWILAPTEKKRPIRSLVAGSIQATARMMGLGWAANFHVNSKELPNPSKSARSLLAAAGVPEKAPAAPADLVPLLEGGLDFEKIDELFKAFRKLTPEVRKVKATEAFPYLMHKLATGHLVHQEIAAGLLAASAEPRSRGLLRHVAHEHTARALQEAVGRLPIGSLLLGSGEGASSAHTAGCQVLEALAALGDRDSIPLALDALDSDEEALSRSALRALIRLTGAVGPRTAYQWRSALASPLFER